MSMEKIIGQFILSYEGKNGYCEYQAYDYKASTSDGIRFLVWGVTPRYHRHLYVVGEMSKEELSNLL